MKRSATFQAGPAYSSGRRGNLATVFKATALVLIMGPPAGSLVISIAAAVSGMADSMTRSTIVQDLPQAIGGWIMLSVFFAAFSYVYGILPVLLSCCWLGWRIYRNGNVSMLETICAAVIAAVISVAVIALLSQDTGSGAVALLAIFTPSAFLSAIICRRLLAIFGVLPLPAKMSA